MALGKAMGEFSLIVTSVTSKRWGMSLDRIEEVILKGWYEGEDDEDEEDEEDDEDDEDDEDEDE